MDDLKCCSICTNQYDNAARKPYSISPCGHYLCFCCINRIENNKCPNCREPITGKIINRAILTLMDMPKEFDNPVMILKNSLVDEIKDLESDMEAARSKCVNKIKKKSNLIKAEIEKIKQKRMAEIERDARILLNQVEGINLKIINKYDVAINACGENNKSQIKLIQNAVTPASAFEIASRLKESLKTKIDEFEGESVLSVCFLRNDDESFTLNKIGQIYDFTDKIFEK
jgi:hypothetical protein